MFPILSLIAIITVFLIISLCSTVIIELINKRKISKLNRISIILTGITLCSAFVFHLTISPFFIYIIVSGFIVALIGTTILVCIKFNRIGIMAFLTVAMICLFYCIGFLNIVMRGD